MYEPLRSPLVDILVNMPLGISIMNAAVMRVPLSPDAPPGQWQIGSP